MDAVITLLRELFEAHGAECSGDASLEGRSGTIYTAPLLCELDGQAVVVDARVEEPVDDDAVAEVVEVLEDAGADAVVLAHTEPSEQASTDARVRLWDRQTLARLLGEALLADALGEEATPLPLPSGGAAATPPLPDEAAMEPRSDEAAQPPAEGTAEDAATPLPETLSDMLPQAFHESRDTATVAADAPDDAAASEEAEPPEEPPVDLFEEHDDPEAAADPTRPEGDPAQPHEERAGPEADPLAAEDPADDDGAEAPKVDLEFVTADRLSDELDDGPESGVDAVDGTQGATWSSDIVDLDALADREPEAPGGEPAASAAKPDRPDESETTELFHAMAKAGPTPRPGGGARELRFGATDASDGEDDSDAEELDTPVPPTGRPAVDRLPVRVPLEDGLQAVQDRLYNVKRAELLLRPAWHYDYECDLLVEGSLRYDTVSGHVAVDASSKRVRELDARFVGAEDEVGVPDEVGLDVRRAKLAADKAVEYARREITSRHTRLVDVAAEDEDQNFHYTEKKRVGPQSDQIRLEPRGLWHRPFWRFWGRNGHMDLDAVTGELVEADLLDPHPDAVMID